MHGLVCVLAESETCDALVVAGGCRWLLLVLLLVHGERYWPLVLLLVRALLAAAGGSSSCWQPFIGANLFTPATMRSTFVATSKSAL